jgi:hypothetical protein
MIEAQEWYTLILCEKKVSLWKEHFLPLKFFQGGAQLSLFQVGLFSWVEKTHASLQRKPSILETGPSRTLFPCENWARFSKEYLLQVRFYKVDVDSLCYKYSYSGDMKKH